jgi:polysaccharide export outer membrane protein
MRVTRWHSSLVLCILSLGVAFAQKDNQQHDGTKDANAKSQQTVHETNGQVQQAKSVGIALNDGGQPSTETTAQPDKPKTQPGVGSAPSPQDQTQTPPPSTEDFPPNASEGAETPRPRIPLPVILDSDSPSGDRKVRREDIKALPDDYVIGAEDMMTVTVWKEKELSGSVVVRPDGRITVPLVGEINVVGMTPLKLESLLEERLKPFITVPKVAIAVNQINSRKVYLIGQVVREGTFPINSSMTVLQVLAGAGGLRDFAKKKKIYILRKRGDQEIRFPFDYDAAIRGRNREENIRVEPGDTIVVP